MKWTTPSSQPLKMDDDFEPTRPWPLAALALSVALAGCGGTAHEDTGETTAAITHPVKLNAAVVQGAVFMRWVGPADIDVWRMESMSGYGVTQYGTAQRGEIFIPNALGTLVRVCGNNTTVNYPCSDWVAPADTSKGTSWFDIPNEDLARDGHAFTSVATVSWLDGVAAANAFCESLGFQAGVLNGWQSSSAVGAICFGYDFSIYGTTDAYAGSSVTSWIIDDLETARWAWAARAAEDICYRGTASIPGGRHGRFIRKFLTGYLELLCYSPSSKWFDVPATALPFTNPNLVSWDVAARAADTWCRTKTNDAGQHFVSGSFNGYYSSTSVGVSCY